MLNVENESLQYLADSHLLIWATLEEWRWEGSRGEKYRWGQARVVGKGNCHSVCGICHHSSSHHTGKVTSAVCLSGV